MRARKLKFGEPVLIKWEDSATGQGWDYHNPRSIGETTEVLSLGYVVSAKPKCLTLTTSIDAERGCLSPVSVPWSAITRLTRLDKKFHRDAEDPSEIHKVE